MDNFTPLPTPEVNEIRAALFSQIMNVMGVKQSGWISGILYHLTSTPIKRMSSISVELDRNIAQKGWYDAVSHLKSYFVEKIDLTGAETMPEHGPLMVVSNHPAAYDIVILASSIQRNDVKILASDIPIIQMLPNIAQHLIPVPYNIPSRLQTVRSTLQHLNNGGTVILFPRGNVEPDPMVSPGAEQSLLDWSPSIELFLKRVPQTQTVVAIASGILSKKWYKNPFINLWKNYEQRQKVAEIFQIASQLLTGRMPASTPRVTFSPPLAVSDLGGQDALDGTLLKSIIDQARKLLSLHPHC